MTDYQKLFEELKQLQYPDTMIPIPIGDNILTHGFFPGGKGTFNNDETISDKNIMILGQDFDCEKNYKAIKNNQEDIDKNFTWKNLLSFLEKVGTKSDECFYTNAIMGIRKGNIGTGKSPAFMDGNFINQCQVLFLKQLEIQKPKAIFVLGKNVAEFLASLEKDGFDKLINWKRIKNFAEIDEAEAYLKTEVIFINDIVTNLVILVHPSLRHANLRHRRLVNYSGNDVEVEMVKDFLKSIKF